MDNETPEEEFVVGTIPANTQELSNLTESSDELDKEIMYLMGGVEAYVNRNNSTRFPYVITREDFNFNFNEVVQRILKYLRNLIKDIFDGSAAGALAVEAVISRAEQVLLNGRSQRRNHNKTDFVISTRVLNLSVKYRPIVDPQQLLTHVKILGSVIKTVMTYLTHTVYGGFDELMRFNVATDDIDDLATSLQNSAPSVLLGDAKFTNNGFRIVSPQLLGCQQVVIDNKRGDSLPLEQILGCSMYLDTAEKDPKAVPDTIRYEKFGLSLEQSIVREVISLGNILSSYNTINRRSVKRSRLDLIARRMETLVTQIDNNNFTEDKLLIARNYIRVLEVYSGWITSPYVGVIALAHRTLSALLNVCEANAK